MTTEPTSPEPAPTPGEAPKELQPVRARFDAGDVRGARGDARGLLGHADPAVAAAARAFLTETDSDPMAFAATLVALGVLVLVATAYLL